MANPSQRNHSTATLYVSIIVSMNIAELAGLITSIGSLIGAFVLWRKSRPEVRKIQAESSKIMAEESRERTNQFSTEIEAIRENYDRMLKTQLESIVKPMEHRIDRLNKLVRELQDEVDELKSYRNRFDIAVLYIRSLCHWIDAVLPDSTDKPKLPPELRNYFNEEYGEEK